MPTDPNDPLSHQNLKDMYYGVNDPVAEKLMSQASDMPMLSAPDDRSITSLYVGGVDTSITEKDLRCEGSFVVLYPQSLVCRPSLPPVFDRLQYVKT